MGNVQATVGFGIRDSGSGIRGSAGAFFFVLLLIILPAILPAASGTILFSSHTDRLYPVMTDEASTTAMPQAYEEAVGALRDEFPGAAFVDAGFFMSIADSTESAYSHPVVAAHKRLEPDAIHLTARDAAIGTSGFNVYQHDVRKDPYDPLFGSVQGTYPKELKIPGRREVKAGGVTVTLVSLASVDRARGFVGKALTMEQVISDAQLGAQIALAREAGRVVIGLTERDPAALGVRPLPHLVVDLRPDPVAQAQEVNGMAVLPPPGPGRLMALTLEQGEDGGLADFSAKYDRYLPEGQWASLLKFPVASIGFPVPNIEGVVPQFFDADPRGVRVDQTPISGLAHLTNLDDVSIYHLQDPEGKALRLYRVYSRMPAYSSPLYPLSFSNGFPLVDMLVAVQADHRLHRVINRTRFSVAHAPTGVLEALNKNVGKDADDDFYADPALVAGVEDVWDWGVHEVKNVLLLDEELYGTDGLLAIE